MVRATLARTTRQHDWLNCAADVFRQLCLDWEVAVQRYDMKSDEVLGDSLRVAVVSRHSHPAVRSALRAHYHGWHRLPAIADLRHGHFYRRHCQAQFHRQRTPMQCRWTWSLLAKVSKTLVRSVPDLKSQSLPSKGSHQRSKMFQSPVSQTTSLLNAASASLLHSAIEPELVQLNFV